MIESLSKLAINQIASSLVVEYDSDWFKSLWARFFLRVDPLPSGYGGGGGGGGGCQKSCFKSAENRAASSLEVAAYELYGLVQLVKTLMGLEPFEVRFFFRQQFTKLDLALK